MIKLDFFEATESDLPIIISLLAEDELGSTRENVNPDVFISYQTAFQKIQKDINAKIIVVKHDNQIIGVAQINFLTHLIYQGGTRGHIEGVRIKQEYQNQGIGTQFFQYLINLAKTHSCYMVQLTTNKVRVKAHRFYKKLGFVNSHEGFKLDLTTIR